MPHDTNFVFSLYLRLTRTFLSSPTLLFLAVDEEFEVVSAQLLKRTQAMLNKYRLLLLEESRVSPAPAPSRLAVPAPARAARAHPRPSGFEVGTGVGCVLPRGDWGAQPLGLCGDGRALPSLNGFELVPAWICVGMGKLSPP